MRLKRLALAALTATVIAVACRTVAPPAQAPRQVVVLSLDGAGAQELWRLHEAGAFGPDGFERLLREGEVARRLLPVNPALTAVNHISLASGFPPARLRFTNRRKDHSTNELVCAASRMCNSGYGRPASSTSDRPSTTKPHAS